jgi:hypothetical protein
MNESVLSVQFVASEAQIDQPPSSGPVEMIGREFITMPSDGLSESALEPKAVVERSGRRFRYVPRADIGSPVQ